MKLILYSKPGCHLCEGLQEKLNQIQVLSFDLEVRDISTRDDWLLAYQHEVPVLCRVDRSPEGAGEQEVNLPRPSPRATVAQLTQLLQKYSR
jgi:hypothetical protein